LFFEDIAIRILKQLFPNGVPEFGLDFNSNISLDRSPFIDEYFFESLFNSLSNKGVAEILKLIK
jgi:hypothetical protein